LYPDPVYGLTAKMMKQRDTKIKDTRTASKFVNENVKINKIAGTCVSQLFSRGAKNPLLHRANALSSIYFIANINIKHKDPFTMMILYALSA